MGDLKRFLLFVGFMLVLTVVVVVVSKRKYSADIRPSRHDPVASASAANPSP